jgi:hypothetical protein
MIPDDLVEWERNILLSLEANQLLLIFTPQ